MRCKSPPDECLCFDDEEECVAGARRLGLRAYLVDRSAPSDDWEKGAVKSLHTVPQLASVSR